MSSYFLSWNKLISEDRFQPSSTNNHDIRTSFNGDYDRLIFSAAFRRLDKKTQVHPLAQNDHIHNRLTHSLEVSSVARSLGYGVGTYLKNIGELPHIYHQSDISQIVQSAAIAHDIGNPPFGHAGEYAIRNWFIQNSLDETKSNFYGFNLLTKNELLDLKCFEGNAQGFRIVSHTEGHYREGGLRLTNTTLASIIKYPINSSSFEGSEMKAKFNFYQSSQQEFNRVFSSLGLVRSNGIYIRHPLSYLMEAADDICYRIIDVEDALELGILNFENDIKPIFEKIIPKDKLEKVSIATEALGKHASNRRKIIPYRAWTINLLTEETLQAFKNHYQDIMNGEFNKKDLISAISPEVYENFQLLKNLANERVFNHTRKIQIEIGCNAVMDILLDNFMKAIKEFHDKEYENSNISFQSKRIIDLIGDKNELFYKGMSFYESCQIIVDYVSGMTDNYATYLAKQLMGHAD